MKKKLVLVTGGSKGIGRAIVEDFHNLGATVLTCGRTPPVGLPKDVLWFSGDVSTDEGCQALLGHAAEVFEGQLDILINNVGTNIRKPTVQYSEAEFERIFRTNFISAFNLSRRTFPLLQTRTRAMRASGLQTATTSIVNISSVAASLSMNTGSVYASTKGAMNQLTKSLACEWAKDGVRVNAVSPWYIHTPLAAQVLKDPAYLARVMARTPMQRVGEPREVSSLLSSCEPHE
jgi:Tropinone reductase 1